MLVLGFNGSFDLINERRYGSEGWHDAAAVLIEDGNVLFAIEEERLDRIKHSDKLPVRAIRACLASRNVCLNDLDMICYYSDDIDSMRKDDFLNNPQEPALLLDPAMFLRERFRSGLGETVDAGKFRFVHHHHAHAASAFALSGFKTSLIITLDAEGDELSGIVLEARENEYKRVDTLSVDNSLGHFYKHVIKYLGYNLFDEYKVMGLAPYGNPARFRGLFRTFYSLLPEGRYEIHDRRCLYPLFDVLVPRRTGEPFSQEHKDIAAALQESVEEIAFHIIKHYRAVTGQRNLCLAGGVAHNCTLNGKLLRSGLFENVFVQPAAHDAGCALGAALYAYYEAAPGAHRPSRLEHVYWGTDTADDDSTLRELAKWSGFLEFNKEDNIVERTAELLASDRVIGWVQGRSEFGPRALGNRSILADPRPAGNKDRINQLVKKREGYRPFAPSVIEEEAETFFEVRAEREQLGFMVFVVDVKNDKRELLGAVTHVDGTARIQSVSRRTNSRFWELIRAFGERTGVPVLLNTSFNNNVEPIVDSTEDAIVCFLTTGLDYLIIGNHLIRKREISWEDYLSLSISLPPYVSLHRVRAMGSDGGGLAESVYLGVSFDLPNTSTIRQQVSNEIAECLSLVGGKRTVREILRDVGSMNAEETRAVVGDLIALWSRRLITMRP